ncbi:hypothetical protein [Emticicia sp. C21]|uniref:hypothetical protein n=1 Tax=Emticicia sp. C21 TaxID=2302915 RepID=UPI000E34E8B1|nr:hypothetical protein [Emticicia sp. C21]RFS13509.1 hypothetical protein D0T08_26095 [Emticicia sp. C21]
MNTYNGKSSQNTKNKKLKTYITIQTTTYKSFLCLFDRNGILEDFEFGDTGYKKEGYVDEKIFNGLHTVGDILDFEYDSDEPIVFNAKIDQLEIKFIGRQFRVYGENFRLRILINKIVELNAYNPDTYVYSKIQPMHDSR